MTEPIEERIARIEAIAARNAELIAEIEERLERQHIASRTAGVALMFPATDEGER